MAELLGSLLVRLGLESGAFKSGLDASTKELRAAQKKFEQVGQSMSNIGRNMTLGITLPLLAAAGAAVKGAQEQAAAMGQVEAALKSMGDASGKTAAELAKNADAMEMRSLFNADEILTKVTANLLTFGNVAGEQFDRAQQAAIDMATRMGSDPQSAAIMLGKALNDPIKGITALTRVGVQFTDAQKKQIKALQDTGQTAKAQGIILAEVERQFKGAAQAAADTQPWRKAEVAIGQAMDKIGEAILPIIPVIADAIASVATAFADVSPEMQKFILAAAVLAAALGPVLFVVGSLVSLAAPLLAALTTTSAATAAAGGAAAGASTGFAALAAAAAPWIAGAAAIAAAGYLIYKNWDKIAPALQEAWQTVSATLGPPLLSLVSAVSEAFTALWEGPLGSMLRVVGAMLLDAFGGAIPGVLKVLTSLIGGAFNLIADSIRLVVALLSGDWAGAWEAAKDLVGNAASAIGGIIEGLGSAIGSWATAIGKAVGIDVPAAWEKAKAAAADGGQVMLHHMQALSSLARGDFSGAWEHAKASVKSFGDMIGVDFGALKDAALGHLRNLVNGVASYMTNKLNEIWNGVRNKIEEVKGYFFGLYDAVVGHSYIPDMVDGIGVHMARLDKEMVAPVKKATSKATEAFREMQERVLAIMDRLFPEARAKLTFDAELKDLDGALAKGGMSADVYAAAVSALRREYLGLHRDMIATEPGQNSYPGVEVVEGTKSIGEIARDELDRLGEVFEKTSERAKVMKVQVVETFSEMVTGALNEVDRFIKGIKSGNWLDIVSGLLGALDKLGAVFTGGKGFNIGPATFGKIEGARAAGGPVTGGRTYLVGEQGPELFTPRMSGGIVPNHEMGGKIATIVPSPYFDVVVDGRVVRAAPAIAQAGSATAQVAMQRTGMRRVG